ncbi:hypothetical protein ACFSUK_16440 [Sphingobium scionense]|uniref:RHS repeat protein n=1 Tax=Sphingobium scionense TaxID=1404341 RepID=A0A7W6LQ06_9SPHN|nr:hypothetical protein [Sphingobium scionense]MBB4148369.1 hypothetical protein [Sphingobium scionense]
MANDERCKAIGSWTGSATMGVRGVLVLAAATLPLGLGLSAAHAASTTTYAYDALGRLVQASTIGTVNSGVQMNVAYDATDNRMTYQVTGSVDKVVVVPLNGLSVIPIKDD